MDLMIGRDFAFSLYPVFSVLFCPASATPHSIHEVVPDYRVDLLSIQSSTTEKWLFC